MNRLLGFAVAVSLALNLFYIGCSGGGGGGSGLPVAEADSPELLERVAELERALSLLRLRFDSMAGESLAERGKVGGLETTVASHSVSIAALWTEMATFAADEPPPNPDTRLYVAVCLKGYNPDYCERKPGCCFASPPIQTTLILPIGEAVELIGTFKNTGDSFFEWAQGPCGACLNSDEFDLVKGNLTAKASCATLDSFLFLGWGPAQGAERVEHCQP